jgi:hypothetical protein
VSGNVERLDAAGSRGSGRGHPRSEARSASVRHRRDQVACDLNGPESSRFSCLRRWYSNSFGIRTKKLHGSARCGDSAMVDTPDVRGLCRMLGAGQRDPWPAPWLDHRAAAVRCPRELPREQGALETGLLGDRPPAPRIAGRTQRSARRAAEVLAPLQEVS